MCSRNTKKVSELSNRNTEEMGLPTSNNVRAVTILDPHTLAQLQQSGKGDEEELSVCNVMAGSFSAVIRHCTAA